MAWGRNNRWGWNGAKQRLFLLALVAFLSQATLPFLSSPCQSHESIHKAGVSVAEAMDDDCPMAEHHHGMAASDSSGKDHHHDHSTCFCPFCAIAHASHNFVVAGLVSLPPPSAITFVHFVPAEISTLPLPRQSGFSARGPPLSA